MTAKVQDTGEASIDLACVEESCQNLGCTSNSWFGNFGVLFKSWSTVWIPVISGRECHFQIRRMGRDCWPCRLKFNMADVSKHAIALDRNICRVYKLISHDIFILMFCNSLQQCKISVRCSCCTRVSRNHLFSGVNQNKSFYNKSGLKWNQLM